MNAGPLLDLEKTLREKSSRQRKCDAVLAALAVESERAELDLIRRRLKMPVAKRLNFLRVRLPGGGSRL